MRKLGVVLALAMLAALSAGPASAGATSPFVGTWTSIDPVDGSTQHMTIRGGTNLQIEYVDEYATTCVNIGASTVVFTGVLTGRIFDSFLVGEWKSAGCGSQLVLRAADRFAWFFVYDPNTDTLYGALNDGPAVWSRS